MLLWKRAWAAWVAGSLCSLDWEALLIFGSDSGSVRFCIESLLNFWTFCDRCLSSHYITAATAFSVFIGVKTFSLCSVAHLASGDIKIAPWFSLFFSFFFWSNVSACGQSIKWRDLALVIDHQTHLRCFLSLFSFWRPGVSCNIISTTGTEPSDLSTDAI